MTKFIGIDYGKKRVGVAVSDDSGTLAFPEAVLENSKELTSEVVDIYKEKNAEAIVLGSSFDNDGKENPIMKHIRQFKKELEDKHSIPVHFESEFLTSVQARRIEDDPEKIDAQAAALILQSFLDRSKK